MGKDHPNRSLIPAERIEHVIYSIRGHRVMLDADLARLYGVLTSALNQAVKRNRARFPADFMFQLSSNETANLRSHFGSSKGRADSNRLISQTVISKGRGGRRRSLPYAFTEQGVAMLSSVLNSERAIHVNIAIMRTFVRFRQLLATNAGLARRLTELEKKYDKQFRIVFEAIDQLMTEPDEPDKPQIGFQSERHAAK